MGNRSTTNAIWRSRGGASNNSDVYAGSMVMAAAFYMADPTQANTVRLDRSATDGRDVILPPNAIIDQIQLVAGATGGTNPTFDLGYISVSDATNFDVDGIIAEGDADAGASVFNAATATAGASLGAVIDSDEAVAITGGVGASAPTGGVISGIILYHVEDDGGDSTTLIT
jgi:hypothetical protein